METIGHGEKGLQDCCSMARIELSDAIEVFFCDAILIHVQAEVLLSSDRDIGAGKHGRVQDETGEMPVILHSIGLTKEGSIGDSIEEPFPRRAEQVSTDRVEVVGRTIHRKLLR